MTIKGNSKVEIINTVKAQVGFRVPNSNIRKQFRGKYARTIMSFEDLEQAFYEPGVSYLFESGILYIEDMEAKKRLGLEDEDATEPTRLIILNEKESKDLLTNASLKDFTAKIEILSTEQLRELAETAVDMEIDNMRKANILKEATGIDVLRRIRDKQEIEKESK